MLMHGDPQIVWLQSMCSCLKCIHLTYFKNKAIFLMSSQGNVKGYLFQKQEWWPLILMFYFDSLSLDDYVGKKLEKNRS